MRRFSVPSYKILMMIMLTAFSSCLQSYSMISDPKYVYASNMSCSGIADQMTCEKQQIGRTSDGSGVIADKASGTSTLDSENEGVPLLIPKMSPTLDDNEGGDNDGDDQSADQDNLEMGNDDDEDHGASSEEENDRDSNADNGDDNSDTRIPLVLPFP